jgi:hypothetical protein
MAMGSSRLEKVFAVVIGLLLISGAARGQGMWGLIDQAIKKGDEFRAFCTKNPEHDRCQPTPASTVLIWCESSDPSNSGSCHGALRAFASNGARLPEWQCVPRAVLDNTTQLQRLFVREGQRMPEILHQPAEKLLYYAVAKAFPCPLLQKR